MRALPPPRLPLLLAFAASAALLAGAACSTFNPNVGPLQTDGATASACALGASGYASNLGPLYGTAAAQAFCSADGGTLQSACDTCEATSCCAQRVACYSDQTCSCADTSIDACLSSASAVADASAGTAACWAAFAASNAIGAARLACLEASCKSACPVPK